MILVLFETNTTNSLIISSEYWKELGEYSGILYAPCSGQVLWRVSDHAVPNKSSRLARMGRNYQNVLKTIIASTRSGWILL